LEPEWQVLLLVQQKYHGEEAFDKRQWLVVVMVVVVVMILLLNINVATWRWFFPQCVHVVDSLLLTQTCTLGKNQL
jgi:uncharacterized ion transporter superfamily protein YfcC